MLQVTSLRAQPSDPNAAAAEYRKAYAAIAKEVPMFPSVEIIELASF